MVKKVSIRLIKKFLILYYTYLRISLVFSTYLAYIAFVLTNAFVLANVMSGTKSFLSYR